MSRVFWRARISESLSGTLSSSVTLLEPEQSNISNEVRRTHGHAIVTNSFLLHFGCFDCTGMNIFYRAAEDATCHRVSSRDVPRHLQRCRLRGGTSKHLSIRFYHTFMASVEFTNVLIYGPSGVASPYPNATPLCAKCMERCRMRPTGTDQSSQNDTCEIGRDEVEPF